MVLDRYIRKIELKREEIPSFTQYPFCLPAVKDLAGLEFHPNVTFLVGENGTGKSTILEAVAIACGFNPEGGSKNFNFSSRNTHSDLYKHIRVIKGAKQPRDGFFLRAETLYNVASNIDDIGAADFYGGVSLHEQSHGESFLSVFLNRFRGKGLYILDEPEAALSPSRQLSMITRMHELIRLDSQFIIATHSPIIMAYPLSTIYQVDKGCKKVAYEETEHYQVIRSFMNNPRKMLKILMDE